MISLADIKSKRPQNTTRIIFPPSKTYKDYFSFFSLAKSRQNSHGPKEVILKRRKPGESLKIRDHPQN